MFFKIFLFEIQNRIRRPAVYLYFAAVLIFTMFVFATGSLPVGEKEHINAPHLIAFWSAGMSMMMMLVSSSLIGTSLYRDIEYNTKDYYLTYPITKAGYFWGRFFGSFIFMIFIASGILFGTFIGTKLGPAMGSTSAAQYGPNNLLYYFHPFLTIVLPNILFTAALFFGLVSITRSIKIIYFGGILLFLFYFLSMFFFDRSTDVTAINIADPFAMNGIRFQMNRSTSIQQNTTPIPITGSLLTNRILWTGIGLFVLVITYINFSFEKFFSGKRDKARIDDDTARSSTPNAPLPQVSFEKPYNKITLINLTKIEILNIIRDNYFWIIVSAGSFFLGFVFWIGNNFHDVKNFPTTVSLLAIFYDVFPFFIFFIIMFYTGETLHRDRATRYAFINDSLPPPNWVMNASKLITLFCLALLLSLLPIVIGLIVQILKGFHQFNFPIYFTFVFLVLLPRLLEMVMFCYMIHVVINSKFVAHAVGVCFWVIVFISSVTHTFDYNLLLYSYTPFGGISDMDGIGHMIKPVNWFNVYWLIAGGLLIILSALFYFRGVSSSFKERLQIIPERFDRKTKIFTAILAVSFILVGAFNYYNVSYLNNYLTKWEYIDRAILYEKTLKRYENMPLPKLTAAKMFVDLYPDKQEVHVKAYCSIINKTDQPISEMLLDAEELTDYTIKLNGKIIPYTCPLVYERGMFNWFRPKNDTSDFRLYNLPEPLAPGDSAVVEINSYVAHKGFSNDLYASNLLRNGIFFEGGLPALGYDAGEEITNVHTRKKNNLPEKKEEDIPWNDPVGVRTLRAGAAIDLFDVDITVSTSADQTATAPGELVQQWKNNGRNYFHFVQKNPGMYSPMGIISAKYQQTSDSIFLNNQVNIDIFYHPTHDANIQRLIAAYKDGIKYYSESYGQYPFKNIRLAEASIYGPYEASMTTLDACNESFGWTAHFTDPNKFDYVYFNTTKRFAEQWWRFQVAPNHTTGSMIIPEGLSTFDALMLAEKKYGKENMRNILLDQLWFYLYIRTRLEEKEHPLISADKRFEWSDKASVALYGLKDLIGEDTLNKALREFKETFAFRNHGPFAGSHDLYNFIQKHVPDSLQYFLTDTWEKITLYDNKVNNVKVSPTTNKDEYKVVFNVSIDKVWIDEKGNDVIAQNMNDYIDIGVLGAESKDENGRIHTNPLFVKKYKLTRGVHSFSIIVKGKPATVAVDPFAKLIDRLPNDNLKSVDTP